MSGGALAQYSLAKERQDCVEIRARGDEVDGDEEDGGNDEALGAGMKGKYLYSITCTAMAKEALGYMRHKQRQFYTES